ncbi:MAG TPA: type II toxin-antitoxin system PemK/MazF family toxin [Ardenticatenaceae bacterium]|nr:type II toxin-antitoxin system PemK/MazF family toxin [Ardenticatenaceae bacterium]
MLSTTRYKQGDVLLVLFPFTDQSATKQQPAVMMSSDAYNRTHPDVILASIASQIGHSLDEVVLLDWRAAGLLKPSVVKPILSSFDLRLVRRKPGAVSISDLALVRALFARVLNLP